MSVPINVTDRDVAMGYQREALNWIITLYSAPELDIKETQKSLIKLRDEIEIMINSLKEELDDGL